MSLAWFGCEAGASGDMFLGALVDVGAPLEVMQSAVDAVSVEHVSLRAREVTRAGLAATKVEVHAPHSDIVRTWGNIRGLLEGADLDDAVRGRALDVFARLARAEALAHRVSPEQVHFHEVGALDAIADIVGSCAGLHALGVERVDASAVAVGSGMVRSEHGLLPVPAPAVLSVLAEADAPIHAGPIAREMCTPTGAALLAATVSRWGGLPPMRVRASGAGAGTRDHDDVPNVLRLVLGEPVAVEESVSEELVLESNVDDLDPRLWPAVLAALFEAGASDAWLTPILMKKGRPAHTLSVLTAPEHADAVRRVVFTESSTIGMREHRIVKRALVREMRTVTVDGVEIAVKVALLDGEVANVAPEYDAVAAAAARLGRPVKAVLAAAIAAAHPHAHHPH
jgi:pyridinium-3,5-bisthiocarboxylic acid mononucleotide nickel chelatase